MLTILCYVAALIVFAVATAGGTIGDLILLPLGLALVVAGLIFSVYDPTRGRV